MVGNREQTNRNRPSAPPLSRKEIGEIRFDTLVAADLPQVVDIERICYRYPWSIDSLREVIADRTFASLAARGRDGHVIAYIIFSEVVDELHILNVAVHPDFRRFGIATAMLAYLHRAALARGRKHAFLEVRDSNQAAQDLYAKFGYRPLSRRKEYYSENQEDAIVMSAPLKKMK